MGLLLQRRGARINKRAVRHLALGRVDRVSKIAVQRVEVSDAGKRRFYRVADCTFNARGRGIPLFRDLRIKVFRGLADGLILGEDDCIFKVHTADNAVRHTELVQKLSDFVAIIHRNFSFF